MGEISPDVYHSKLGEYLDVVAFLESLGLGSIFLHWHVAGTQGRLYRYRDGFEELKELDGHTREAYAGVECGQLLK